MEQKSDFSTTQRFLMRHAPALAVANRYVTPATLGGAMTTLIFVIGALVNAQRDLRSAKEDILAMHETISVFQKQTEVLHEINTQLAVIASKEDDIGDQVDRLQQWRDKIEGIAEAPPHARRRR